MPKIADLPEFDMADYLDNDEAVAQYLSVVLAEGDAGELADALGHIAKARGMAQIAKDSGLGREALYKALRPGALTVFLERLHISQRTRRCAPIILETGVPLPALAFYRAQLALAGH